MAAQEPRRIYKNSLLASCPDIDGLEAHLSPRIFNVNQTLYGPGQKVDTVYFLEDGICSLVVTMENGNSIEVGIIGRDGFVGMPAVLGASHSPGRSFMQVAGSGYALSAKVLMEESRGTAGELLMCLLRGVQGLLIQTAQTAACNRVHELEGRLGRWLLMCQDRMQSDELAITHEFLAIMLGTNRSSVTIAAGMLQKAGLIEYSRGRVRIENREGLEKAACECYAIVHEEYVRLKLL